MFCTKCGKQIADDVNFCPGCGTRVGQAATPTEQPTAQQANQQQYTIYERFSPAMGIGRSFILTNKSLIYGNKEYSYSDFVKINLSNVPTTALMNGTAQAILKSGNKLLLAFAFNQKDKFISTMNYANEQIDSANGVSKNYKYLLQSSNGSKVEVYDDYIRLYYIPLGLKNTFSNAMRSGAIEQVMYFDDISVSINQPSDSQEFYFVVEYKGESISIPLKADSFNEAEQAVEYITKQSNSTAPSNEKPESIKDVWKSANGQQREFPLCGHTLKVSSGLDVFNTYRLMFRKFADECANSARAEYNKKVRDLVTYLQFTPEIYGYYLAAVCDKAVQILISDGIWNITQSDFINAHKAKYHLVFDDISVTVESVELTIEKNQRSVANTMSFVPNLIGGGFGLKGAVKGIARATAFNLARNSIESSLIKGAANINAAQQTELYNRIKPDVLFEHFFLDYWRVFLTVVSILHRNKKNVWLPIDSNIKNADGVFDNLSNPNFPKEQLVAAFIKILQMKPYDKRYYKFMVSHFGDTEEVKAIRNYFGYTDFNNPRIT